MLRSSRLDPHAAVILGGDSDLMLMALMSEQRNLFVVNDNQDLFGKRAGLHGSEMIKMATEQRGEIKAFSTNALREAWRTSPDTCKLVKVPVPPPILLVPYLPSPCSCPPFDL